MRISDWSSDVCSSDLVGERPGRDRQRMFDRVEHRPTARVDREQRRRPGIAEQFALHVRTPERLAQSPRHLARQRHLETPVADRSEEHTSELQSLMRISYAVFCLKKKNTQNTNT